ncbi:hypothetical protein [Lysobacter silvisoli]|uniref:DUF4189 domain-containing protein n=1 Tax=Lysobacter silvisoli TaxID=2293254 RepID=A0A371JZY7_9GAMM|nr:hypothetical protein [Lysobacter silvisoli]RDZ27235.1 hypothetical protein DX914_13375 [Lysobacter silvisoli]
MSPALHKFVLVTLAAAAGLATTFHSGRADAACPAGDPCETLHVYRVQSWPTIQHDAAGRPLISLQEANAADAAAFKAAVKGKVASTALAIRYNVTRIADAPNDYCECNLELANKGCASNLPPIQLHQCARVCRRDQLTCAATGDFGKQDSGGRWYAFPVVSMCGGARNVWKKNALGNAKPNWCDWQENARVIKQVSCLATALDAEPGVDLDALFNNPQPCAALDEAALNYLP